MLKAFLKKREAIRHAASSIFTAGRIIDAEVVAKPTQEEFDRLVDLAKDALDMIGSTNLRKVAALMPMLTFWVTKIERHEAHVMIGLNGHIEDFHIVYVARRAPLDVNFVIR